MPLGRRASIAAVAAVVAILALANVSAFPVYRLYLLKDDPANPSPAADGVLDLYDPLHPNFPNITKTPSTRLVFPVVSGIEPVQFLTKADEVHPERIKGPVFVVPYPGPSTVLNGNLTLTLYEIPQGYDPVPVPPLPVPLPITDPLLPPPLGPAAPRALLTVNIPLDANLSNLPDPMQFVPPVLPDPSTDPQAYANYVAAYEVAQLYPVLLKFPKYYIVNVDFTLNATSRLALAVTLTQGSSQAPIPTGAFGQIEYDSLLSLSYIFVPWYSPDKAGSGGSPGKTPPYGATTTYSFGPTNRPSASSSANTNESKGSPDAGLLFLPALGALALALRRRR